MVLSPMVTGDSQAVLALESRAKQVCVVYRDHPMPPGVQPPEARIGVEADSRSGDVSLMVKRGLRYTGTDPMIRQWIRDGVVTFPSIAAAGQWLASALGAARAASVDAALALPAARAGTELSVGQLAAALKQGIRGQDRAMDRLAHDVVTHVRRSRPRRPATIFMIGPTGVGKTETAERLAGVLAQLPGEEAYDWLRLDMNEYREAYRVSKLLGAPPGYVGYREGAPLADALTANPRHVILFDEIEKAHPDVLIVLMNLIDRGRLSGPGAGQPESDGRPAILLFTSNQCADELAALMADASLSDVELDQACRRQLRESGVTPALLGRIGTMLPFRPLDDRALAEIAFAAIEELAADYDLRVAEVEPRAIRYLIDRYGKTGLGARPLVHAVGEAFVEPLLSVSGQGPVGVVCGYDGSSFTVRRQEAQPIPGPAVDTETEPR
jgi:hypothetical protein